MFRLVTGPAQAILLVVEQAKDYPAYHLDSADVSDDPLRGLGIAVEAKGKDCR